MKTFHHVFNETFKFKHMPEAQENIGYTGTKTGVWTFNDMSEKPPERVSDCINFISQAKHASCMLVTTYKSLYTELSRMTLPDYICRARKR